MSVVLFCGPTLRATDLAPYAHFKMRPPVRQGELYAAAQAKPNVIGIIDGYFDGVPAVWHKEILWALSAGIAVFGAASMGALRAAELHSFGMRGVGRIFEGYRDGQLTDDDEVAILHGPVDSGYLKLSEPMVNIRATLECAIAEGVLDTDEVEVVAAVAKSQFYQERTWKTVLEEAEKVLPRLAEVRFADWLPTGQLDQKREDGLELLRALDDFLTNRERPPPVSFSFEWTETWANAPWLNSTPRDARNIEESAILDELRLDCESYSRVRRQALLNVLANKEISRIDARPTRKEVSRATMQFRSRHSLEQASAVANWAAANDIDVVHLKRLLSDCAGLEKLALLRDGVLQAAMLDQLRMEDSYFKLRRRARAKARALAAGSGNLTKVPPPVLASWYFGTRLKTVLPDDLVDYVNKIGMSNLGEFYALIAAEYAVAAGRMLKVAGRAKK